LGLATNRDEWLYDYSLDGVQEKTQRLIKNYNYEVFRLSQEKPQPESIDEFVNKDPKYLKWTDRLKDALTTGQSIQFDKSKLRRALFRPFTRQWLYFDHLLNQRRYQQHHFFPTPESEAENRVIVVSDIGYRSAAPSALCSSTIPELHFCSSLDGHQCFPFYVYDADGSNRRENVTDWAMKQFKGHYKDKKITKWDVFHYVYGLLHHPGYRTKFADNLKKSLPRIPLAPDFTGVRHRRQSPRRTPRRLREAGPAPAEIRRNPRYAVQPRRHQQDEAK
jgi:predicted helicase